MAVSSTILTRLLLMLVVVIVLLGAGKVPLRYNLRNLVVRWKTTAVTGLAFTLVVALLVIMLAFVNGMNRLAEGSGRSDNVLILSDGAVDEVFSSLPPSVSVHELPSQVQKLVQRDAKGNFIVSQEVFVIVNQMLPDPKPGGPKRRFVQMRGLRDPEVSAYVHDLELLPGGRWFARTGEAEVVLGEGIAKVFGDDRGTGPLGSGDTVEIGPYTWKVAGVMRSAGTTFGSEVWGLDSKIGPTFGKKSTYNVFVARVRGAAVARLAAETLKSSKGSGGQALQAVVEPEYYAKLSDTNNQFLYAIEVVAAFMAFGGVLGVMNTMYAAISQRTKDIGVLRLLGFFRWQILVSFLLESVLIALVGGLLGCGLAMLADGMTLTSIASGSGGGGKSVVFKLTVDGATLVAGMAVALAMGVVGGLVPSLSAMRLRPLESLR